jgi:hypothetical protein
MLTRQEKEKLVIELYNQGKTIREIAKELRISFRDIGAILRKASGEKEKNQNKEQSSLLSPSAQAYRLYSEGKTPLEVAIALDITESETIKYYEEYLELKQMHDLKVAYDEIGSDIVQFLKLYKLSKVAHMNPEHVITLLQMCNEYLPLLEKKRKRLTKEIDFLESEKQKLRDLGNQIGVLARILEKYKKEIKILRREKIRLEILNSSRYEKVRQIVEKEVNNSLAKGRDVLKVAVASVLESISQDPDKYNFLVNSNQYNVGQYTASPPFIDAYRDLISDEAEKLFELMKRDLTSSIINEPPLTVHPKTT